MPSGATAGAASPLYRPKIRSHSFGQQQISLTPSSSGGWGFFPSSPYAVRSVPASPVGARATSRNLSAPCAPRLPVFPPPEHSDQRKAMEAVATAERQRAKEMEAKEENLSAEELRAILKRERHRMGRIAGELASVRYLTGHYQLEAEMCEEGRINCLMRRMDLLQQEKGRIIVELEREEEMVRSKFRVIVPVRRVLALFDRYKLIMLCFISLVQILTSQKLCSRSFNCRLRSSPTLYKRNWIKCEEKRLYWNNKSNGKRCRMQLCNRNWGQSRKTNKPLPNLWKKRMRWRKSKLKFFISHKYHGRPWKPDSMLSSSTFNSFKPLVLSTLLNSSLVK